ncbi:MAG TPA: acyl-CoA dehydrogenase family protein [Acidimicrobiales bacterium]|nr:acyl-CoA dehydrogenase family protein [Acidimicrobiales bacterium]
MDIDDTPEEATFRAEARDWLDAHAIPKGHPDDFSAGLWTDAYDEDTYIARCRDWQRTLFEGGWAGITWPKAHGGRGGKPIEQVIFNQEQARYGVSNGAFMISIGMAGPTILAHGTDEQRDRFLAPMLRGDELWCQLFSEPDAGSDLANVATRAERDGDEWVVNGQKVWTSSPDRARWGMLLARTDGDVPKHRGISYFLLDMATPGIDVRPLRQMTGESHFSEVFLDDVRTPAANLVGGEGEGWRVAQTTLNSERSSIAGGVGATPAALVDLARSLGAATDPLGRQRLVDAHIRFELLRFLRYRSQTALSQGRRPGAEASVMKLAYARYMKALTEAAVDLQGAHGLLAGSEGPGDTVWLRRFLHSPSLRIAGGSDQVQANIVGERALGLPAEPRDDKDVPYRELARRVG